MRRTGELLVTVVANPAAGGTTAALIDEAVAICRRYAPSCTVHKTTGPRQAGAVAAASEHDLIVAIGGDGTIGEVAAALVGRKGPVLVPLPAGSGNSFCLGLWGQRDWRQILESAFDEDRGYVRRLDLLRMLDGPDSGRVAALGISAGFLADVLAAALAGGPATKTERYWSGAATVLAAPPSFPARITVDGVTVHKGDTCLVNVGGGPLRGAGALRLLPQAALDDGLLDVCVVAGMNTDELTRMLPLMMAGQHLGHPGVCYTRGHLVLVERTDGHPLLVEADGELLPARTPVLEVAIVPAAIDCMAPR